MYQIVRKKPEKESDFKGPVAWLFGRELIASLKGTLLYTAFKGKIDSRDWMEPTEHSFADKAESGEFWFDYLADTGDGQKAAYSIAYLCMSDARIEGPEGWEDLPADEIRNLINDEKLKVQFIKPIEKIECNLPRGQFLFIGGDTSYHMADYPTLAERIQEPFWWAYRDIYKSHPDEEPPPDQELEKHPRRLLFGIPGNHDYYDALDGFNRQFRRPSTQEGEANVEGERPQLSIPGFKRCQGASFLALKLPFGWWFWGLDTQQGEIDSRQLQFFTNINKGEIPKKLIVATPEPSTVFGKFIDKDETMSVTFEKLRLPRHFLQEESEKDRIPPEQCRLDISGDVHHYARYWGPDSKKGANDISGKHLAPLAQTNYASVMSGLGGAFLHPSHTDIHELEEQALYPSEEASRKEVARKIFNPWNIYKGGYVFLVGAIIALIVYSWIELSPNGKPILNKLNFLSDQLPRPQALQSDLGATSVGAATEVLPATVAGKFQWLMTEVSSLLAAVDWLNRSLIAVSFITIWGSFLYFKHILKQLENKDSGKEKLEFTDYIKSGGLILISMITLIFPLLFIPEIKTQGFIRSLLFLVPLLWSLGATATSLAYSEVLIKQAKQNSQGTLHTFFRNWRYAPNWVLFIYALAIIAFGIYKFGQDSAAILIFDFIFIGTLALGLLGLPLWALFSGLELHRIKKVKGIGKKVRRVGNLIGFVALGLWHGALQLLTPLLLVRLVFSLAKEHPVGYVLLLVIAILILISLFFTLIAIKLAQSNRRVLLTALWLIYGLSVLGASLLLHKSAVIVNDWDKVFYCALAAAVGAVMSCVWLGWYLAVALAFNGHNNESGGASRIEKFKEFIRFRINEKGLTGFVIAIDEPQIDGSKLSPKIVDYFRLKPSKSDEQ